MYKKALMLAAALACNQSWAFPFEVEEKMQDVTVAVEPLDLGDNTAAVVLHNHGTADAQCSVRFRSGPGVPVKRNARLVAGQKTHVTAGFNHEVIRMRVNVQCKAAGK